MYLLHSNVHMLLCFCMHWWPCGTCVRMNWKLNILGLTVVLFLDLLWLGLDLICMSLWTKTSAKWVNVSARLETNEHQTTGVKNMLKWWHRRSGSGNVGLLYTRLEHSNWHYFVSNPISLKGEIHLVDLLKWLFTFWSDWWNRQM